METLAEKAKRLGIKPAGKPVDSSTAPASETLAQKAQRLGVRPAPKQFTFDVPALEQSRENKIAQYQQEAQQAQEESKKANSFMGKLGNFGKAFVGTIANSEVGLGQSIAKIIGANDTTLQESQQRTSDMQVQLLKAIRQKEARGEDATRLKQEYNRFINDPANKNVENLLKEQYDLPSTGKVVGQIAGTALDLLTAGTYGKATQAMTTGQRFIKPTANLGKTIATGAGIPELGQIATQKAGGFFTKQGAKNMAVGTGIGYTSDVAQGLQGARGEDRTGAKAFIPGAGTALGFTLPAVSELRQSRINAKTGQTTINKRRTGLEDLEKRYVRVDDAFKAADRKGVDAREILSKTDLLNGAVDSDGLISAERGLANFDKFIRPYEGKVREALEKEGRKVSVENLATAADDFISKTRLPGKARTKLENEIADELSALLNGGNSVSTIDLHDLKVFRGGQNNYMDTEANAVNKEVTRFFKELVEKNTDAIDAKKYNEGLSKLYAVRDVIEALDKKRVKGGRLGKYFSSIVGTVAGGSAAGPLGAIFGAEAGARVQGVVLKNAFGANINKGLEPTADLLRALKPKATGKGAIQPVVLPKSQPPLGDINLQSSNSAGSLKTNQSTTIAPTKNVIPPTILPIKEASSKISTGKKKVTPPETKTPTQKALGKVTPVKVEPQKPLGTATPTKANATGNTLAQAKESYIQKLKEISPSQPESWYQGHLAQQPFVKNPEKYGFKQELPKLRELELRDVAKKQSVDYDELTKRIDEKIVKAKGWKEYLDAEVEKITNIVPDTKPALAPIKSKERILEKALLEKVGDIDGVKDIARNTIVPLTGAARKRVLSLMDQRKDIVLRKDQTPDKFMGYEGTIYNIRTPDGAIVETQVVTPKMTYGKNTPEFAKSVLGEDLFNQIQKETGLEPGLGHVYYEALRTMSVKDKMGAKGEALVEKSLDYYNKLM